jgi:hypothetical protein
VCRPGQAIQVSQQFPDHGPLYCNLNIHLHCLKKRLRNVGDEAYSYVVTSVELKERIFEQRGSGPNFEGGVLTLCTCKHQMRASQSTDEWESDVWLVGFTSRTIYEKKHWLFYMAKIESAYESHSDLWKSMTETIRQEKVAHRKYLGDMFKPKTRSLMGDARYAPFHYHVPRLHAHRNRKNPNGWRNDIRYHLADKYGHASLLVADPELTFIWNKPTIFLKQKHCRNYLIWESLQDLLGLLEEAKG